MESEDVKGTDAELEENQQLEDVTRLYAELEEQQRLEDSRGFSENECERDEYIESAGRESEVIFVSGKLFDDMKKSLKSAQNTGTPEQTMISGIKKDRRILKNLKILTREVAPFYSKKGKKISKEIDSVLLNELASSKRFGLKEAWEKVIDELTQAPEVWDEMEGIICSNISIEEMFAKVEDLLIKAGFKCAPLTHNFVQNKYPYGTFYFSIIDDLVVVAFCREGQGYKAVVDKDKLPQFINFFIDLTESESAIADRFIKMLNCTSGEGETGINVYRIGRRWFLRSVFKAKGNPRSIIPVEKKDIGNKIIKMFFIN
ncbi:MAG: hypothetical protein ACM3UU_08740 [Ignavibacteriales bacterium]